MTATRGDEPRVVHHSPWQGWPPAPTRSEIGDGKPMNSRSTSAMAGSELMVQSWFMPTDDGTTSTRGTVLLTDHPWEGVDVERELLAAGGYDLIEAPVGASEDVLVELAADVVGILTCWALVPEAVIAASPRLRVVTRLGVGLDNIDLHAAAQRGVVVTRIPDYCIEEVSDHVVGLVHVWARGQDSEGSPQRRFGEDREDPGLAPVRVDR
jgi:hypothetical protein